jgi:PAS domain S-box-containing protein
MKLKESLLKTTNSITDTRMLLSFIEVIFKSSGPVLIVNAKTEIVYVNQAWKKLTGYTLREVNGRTPQFLNSGRTPKEVITKLWATLEKGKTFTTDEVIDQKKDGSYYQTYSLFYPIRFGKQTLFYVQKQQDITAKAKFVTDLKLQSIILKNMNEGVCMIRTSDLKIVYLNPKFERMFGYKRRELFNIPITKITYGSGEEVQKRTELLFLN